jgi:hypothetical protein
MERHYKHVLYRRTVTLSVAESPAGTLSGPLRIALFEKCARRVESRVEILGSV